MKAVLCAPPPHSPPNDDIVHKLPPVSIFEESSFVCLLPVYLVVIFLRRSKLGWFTQCGTRIKAKKGSATRRFIKQQQQQTTKQNKQHQQLTKPLSWVAKTDGSEIFWILWTSGSGSVDLERSRQNPPTDHGGGLSYYNHTTNYFAKKRWEYQTT